MSVETHNICKYCDNAEFDKPCPTCTDLAWEGFSINEHDKQIREDAIDDAIEMIGNNFDMQELYLPIHIMEKLQELKEQKND